MIYVNGEQRLVGRRSTLLDVLALPGDVGGDESVGAGGVPRGIAVALDGTVVPRAHVGQTQLHEGARVEIVRAVQGG